MVENNLELNEETDRTVSNSKEPLQLNTNKINLTLEDLQELDSVNSTHSKFADVFELTQTIPSVKKKVSKTIKSIMQSTSLFEVLGIEDPRKKKEKKSDTIEEFLSSIGNHNMTIANTTTNEVSSCDNFTVDVIDLSNTVNTEGNSVTKSFAAEDNISDSFNEEVIEISDIESDSIGSTETVIDLSPAVSSTDTISDTEDTSVEEISKGDESKIVTQDLSMCVCDTKAIHSSDKSNDTVLKAMIDNTKNKNTETSDLSGYIVDREVLPSSLSDRYKSNVEALNVLRDIEASGRTYATVNEKKKLAKYSGWGSLASKFEPGTDSEKLLISLLGDNFKECRSSVTTGYYTPSSVIKFMYSALERFGFEKGKVLECSCGTGRMFTYMKEDMYNNSSLYGVDIDPISYKIATLLHPQVEITNSGFEKTDFNDNSFDLCISNVPFSSYTVFDDQDKDLNKYNFKIHDYFFAKALKKVRVGGLIAFITHSGTLDKDSAELREYLSPLAEFIGAVRLPREAFEGVSIDTDIIFLKKLPEAVNPKVSWCKTVELVDGDDTFTINEYYKRNQKNILGKLKYVSSRYGKSQVVTSSEKLNSKSFAKVLTNLPSNVYHASLDDSYMFDEAELLSVPKKNDKDNVLLKLYPELPYLKEDEFVVINECVYRRQRTSLLPVKCFGKKREIVNDFVSLKGALKAILFNRMLSDDELSQLQQNLNTEYDNFVSKYGYINDKKASRELKKFLKSDQYGYCLILGIEEYDKAKNIYTKADVFTKRVVGPPQVAKKPTTVEEAVMCSYLEFADINIEYICNSLGIDEDIVVSELKKTGSIFYNYELQKYESKMFYLSGFVKDKLKYCTDLHQDKITQLESLSVGTDEYNELEKVIDDIKYNIDALKEVQPDEVTEDIKFSLASSWIPVDIKARFIAKTLRRTEWLESDESLKKNVMLTYTVVNGYSLEIKGHVPMTLQTTEWGTYDKGPESILNCILNNKMIEVKTTEYCPIRQKDVTRRHSEKTQLAISMGEKWEEAFEDYIMSDALLYAEIVKIYNETLVRYVEPKYINILGSPSINPEITLREHQLLASSRIMLSNSTLLHHSVGSGKTYTMITAAQELKRINTTLGNHTYKSLFAVPNSLVESGQFAKEYLKLYPDANILAVTKDDFTPSNRRKVLNKIITNNWDSVIISHSILGMIPLKPETMKVIIDKDKRDMAEILAYYQSEGDNSSVRDVEKAFQARISKLERLYDMHKDEYAIYWEDLEVGAFFVDEAHNFKSLPSYTKMRVAGAGGSDSKRAHDMYNKIRYHRTVKDSKLIFATATPIANSMGEMHVFLKYLAESLLEEHNLQFFDAWASVFGEVVSNVEIDATGQNFQVKQSFSKFSNLPELMGLYRAVADIVDVRDLKDVKLPKLITGAPIVESVSPSTEMLSYVDNLVERVDAIQSRSVRPEEDNMLNVVNDGRLLAVAPRCVGIDEDSPKLMKVADNVANLYSKSDWTTHLVFCDLGTPSGAVYNVYDELKRHLLDRGVLEKDIAYIHDAKNSEQRKALINAFKNGDIRVLLASRRLAGEGTNFQDRIESLHHVCCPWRPCDLDQSEGRIIRQGNMNKEVYIFRYVVENSFDSYSWQTIQRKAEFIGQVLKASSDVRSIDDIDSQVMNYSQAKAAACGNKLVMEHCLVSYDLGKLNNMYKAHKRQISNSMNSIATLKKNIARLEEILPILEKEVSSIKDADLSVLNYTYNGVEYRDKELIKEMLASVSNGYAGEVHGLPITIDRTFDRIYLGTSKAVFDMFYSRGEYRHRTVSYLLQSFTDKFKSYSRRINVYIEEVGMLEEFVKKPFAKEDELRKLRSRINELNELIKQEKDERVKNFISKSQEETEIIDIESDEVKAI